MDLFSKNRIFENKEINTLCDRLYYFMMQENNYPETRAMQLITLTGSVAKILAGEILPRPVEDLDFTVSDQGNYDFLIANAQSIFGVNEASVQENDYGVIVQTKYTNLEFFKDSGRTYKEITTKEGIIVKITEKIN